MFPKTIFGFFILIFFVFLPTLKKKNYTYCYTYNYILYLKNLHTYINISMLMT